MMSLSSQGVVAADSSVSSTLKPERMLTGFPWVSAIILYTLSWCWSLLRPNTLYWDDWELFFRRPSFYGRQELIDSGRPPWDGLAVGVLIQLGIWLICLATFLIFFICGLFLFGILKKVPYFSIAQRRFLILLFLIVPVNHARIAVSIFDYTSSYFLFFLGWLILVHYKSVQSFILSWLILFLSLKTHSLLFFMLLPFLHFVWLNKYVLIKAKKRRSLHLRVLSIGLMPLVYLLLRKQFWPPVDDWKDYHHITLVGLRVALVPFIIALIPLIFFAFQKLKKLNVSFGATLFVCGYLITALALLPYFAGELYVGYAGRPAYLTVFEFRADWRSRHQLLMPLGLALSVVGLNELINWRKKNVVVIATLALSMALNMFWGSQYFLMSHKQEQLVELFKTTKDELVIASVEDQAMQFNGRGASFRGYEWSGFMTLADIPTDRPGCEALPTGSALTLKSETPYLKALATRDLGLYFEVTPCSEVLAKNG